MYSGQVDLIFTASYVPYTMHVYYIFRSEIYGESGERERERDRDRDRDRETERQRDTETERERERERDRDRERNMQTDRQT